MNRDEPKLKGPAPKIPVKHEDGEIFSESSKIFGESSTAIANAIGNTKEKQNYISKPFNFQHVAHVGLNDSFGLVHCSDDKFKQDESNNEQPNTKTLNGKVISIFNINLNNLCKYSFYNTYIYYRN